MKNKNLLGIIGAVVVAIGLFFHFSGSGSVKQLGVDVMTNPQWFYNGSYFGKGNWFMGGNAGDASFGVSSSADGSSPVFSISSAGVLSASAMSITTLTAGTFTQGGGVATVATTSTTYTLSASDFDVENVVSVTPGGASLTLTLPASSTFPLGTTAGSVRDIFVVNATTTAGISLTMATTTGVFLRTASSTAIIQSDTAGAKGAVLRAVRKTNSDILVYMTSFNN